MTQHGVASSSNAWITIVTRRGEPAQTGDVDPEVARYGADKSGVLCGCVFEPAQPGEAVDRLRESVKAGETFLNEQTNRTLFILTVLTVVALPIYDHSWPVRDERRRHPAAGSCGRILDSPDAGHRLSR